MAPRARKRRYIGSPAGERQPAPLARSQVATSALRKRLKQGPFDAAGSRPARRSTEQTCGCATGVEKPGPGGTHRSEAARPAASGQGPSLRGRRCGLACGWVLAQPHGLTPQPHVDVAHALTWPQLFGAPRGGFLKTSAPRQLRGLEQAAALVSPRTGLPAFDFSLSTAVLDRPPVHPFASLKGLQPLLRHLKRQCWERQQ